MTTSQWASDKTKVTKNQDGGLDLTHKVNNNKNSRNFCNQFNKTNSNKKLKDGAQGMELRGYIKF